MEPLGFSRSGLPGEVNFPLCLAPMVGLSHWAFRQMVREYLPAGAVTLWPSEMLNSRRIPDENLSRIPEAFKSDDENYWVPQILANRERDIELSLRKLFAWGAQGVDINMGCPVRKALKHNYGVALMGDRDYAASVVEATVRHSSGPVSVKLRAALGTEKKEWVAFVQGLENAGAQWLCLHPRTADQKRRGAADWSQLGELKAAVSLPVIGNGDVQTADEAWGLLKEDICDMVMVGRALTARPWMVWQLGEKMGWPPPRGRELERAPQTAEEEGREYGRSLFRLLELMEPRLKEPLALKKFVFHVKVGSVWIPFGHYLYSKLSGCRSFAQLREQLQLFFSQEQRMYPFTELRQ